MSPVVVAAVARANRALAERRAIVAFARTHGAMAWPGETPGTVVITLPGLPGSQTVRTLTEARYALGME